MIVFKTAFVAGIVLGLVGELMKRICPDNAKLKNFVFTLIVMSPAVACCTLSKEIAVFIGPLILIIVLVLLMDMVDKSLQKAWGMDSSRPFATASSLWCAVGALEILALAVFLGMGIWGIPSGTYAAVSLLLFALLSFFILRKKYMKLQLSGEISREERKDLPSADSSVKQLWFPDGNSEAQHIARPVMGNEAEVKVPPKAAAAPLREDSAQLIHDESGVLIEVDRLSFSRFNVRLDNISAVLDDTEGDEALQLMFDVLPVKGNTLEHDIDIIISLYKKGRRIDCTEEYINAKDFYRRDTVCTSFFTDGASRADRLELYAKKG